MVQDPRKSLNLAVAPLTALRSVREGRERQLHFLALALGAAALVTGLFGLRWITVKDYPERSWVIDTGYMQNISASFFELALTVMVVDQILKRSDRRARYIAVLPFGWSFEETFVRLRSSLEEHFNSAVDVTGASADPLKRTLRLVEQSLDQSSYLSFEEARVTQCREVYRQAASELASNLSDLLDALDALLRDEIRKSRLEAVQACAQRVIEGGSDLSNALELAFRNVGLIK